jgi:urea transport system permease protein
VIGATFVSLLSSLFTSGHLPDIPLGPVSISWVDWWLVILGLSFVAVTLLDLKGIGGIFDRFQNIRPPDRKGAPLGPDEGSFQEQAAQK